MNLTPELARIKDELEGYARECGLDFFPVIFEVLDWKELNEVASFGGFPNRYPHWRFGMEYEDLSKRYAWGLSKIYEMVINNDPCYAYLLYANSIVDQKLVMAHVYAHCDFFKNNIYFAHTNRKMMDEMGNHRTRIMNYINKYGQDTVEEFVDACLSIDTLIDCHAPAIKRVREREEAMTAAPEEVRVVKKLRAGKSYMDKFINPPNFLKEQAKRLVEQQKLEKRFPESPERDIMGFCMDYAQLEKWQRDILSMMREEAYYFLPQGQTKIMNEGWACVDGDTLIVTGDGLISAREIVEKRKACDVSDGAKKQKVYDWACFKDRETIEIRTKRGFRLNGSVTHQVMMCNGEWKRLDNVRVGDKIKSPCGTDLWPTAQQKISWTPLHRRTLQEIAGETGVHISTVIRHKYGEFHSRSAASLDPLLAAYQTQVESVGFACQKTRNDIKIPSVMDERLASFIGYLVGDGHISRVKRVLGLTTGDEIQADHFIDLARQLFGVKFKRKRDDNGWRVFAYSENLSDLLEWLGLKTGVSARFKDVPPIILRSPKKVVAAFLRSYFDCDGYAGPGGIKLSTSSKQLCHQVQQLLLNFGIISTRIGQPKDIWHLCVFGVSAKKFAKEIGFGLGRKQKRLNDYINRRNWFRKENLSDEIVSVECGRGDVYDFSVDETHRYAAAGFINHNSYWHSKIMTTRALKDSELIDYADHHSGTVAPYPGRLNPYKMGLELFKDIEERWNKGRFGKEYDECENMVEKAKWDKRSGLGLKKIFEVRRLYSDITFIDEFLTPEFCKEHKLFTFAYNPTADQYEIASREFKKIKEKLLFQLTNFGHPIIEVADGNYKNRGELLLKHRHEGVDLRHDYARETLKSLYKVWGRPVNIETLVEDVPKVLSFDGEEFKEFRP